jgi:cytochrome c
MDSFEVNKIAGAVLGVLLFAMGLNVLSGELFRPRKAGELGYALPEPAPQASAGAGAPQQAAAPSEPLPVLLAKADPTKGQTAARKCLSCHSLEKGGPNKVGPNLYGVIGRPVASHAGFNYSAALKGKGGEWSFEQVDQFVHSPKGYAPGTTMGSFPGVPSGNERADILAYLRTLSDSPAPLPAP